MELDRYSRNKMRGKNCSELQNMFTEQKIGDRVGTNPSGKNPPY